MAILRLERLHLIALGIEHVEVREDHVTLDLSRVARPRMPRIGEHGAHLRPNLVGRGGEGNAVAERFARLPAIDAGQSRRIGEKGAAFGHDRAPGEMRQSSHDLVRLLDHGKLIIPHRHQGSAESGDVGRLAHRVGEESGGDVARESAKRDLRAHRRITLQSSQRDQVEIQDGQLG